MNTLRKNTPKRTCAKKYRNYRRYKKYLKKDFHGRCGYCNDEDIWCGGTKVFHIDHFAPWKRFEVSHPAIKTDYINLVYACPYCNCFKSDDWVSNSPFINIIQDKGYIDPCDVLYDSIFTRTNIGEILPMTKTAEYMYEKLGLGLDRHSLIWQMEKLLEQREELENLIRNPQVDSDIKQALKQQKELVTDEFFPILKMFFQSL